MSASDKVRSAILELLDQLDRPVGASALAERLGGAGLQPRSVRYHLMRLDREGLTKLVSRRRGREITDLGREALSGQRANAPSGDWRTQSERLAPGMEFRLREGRGTVAMDVALVHQSQLLRCVEDMKHVFGRRLGTGHRIASAREGERLAGTVVPRHHAGFGVVSIAALCEVARREGLPAHLRSGVLVEMREDQPVRIVERIGCSDTTMDPSVLLIRAGLTRVRECARSGAGLICGYLIEIPDSGLDRLHATVRAMERHALAGTLKIGRPGQPVLNVPIQEGRTGWVLASGLNPWAAIHETGAPIRLHPCAGLESYARARPFHEWRERLAG
ncbi:MAG: DUF128 domain-containing protein [Kiritimatiellae bacterium]|nr:DUF128 domain-containing protein [Kiritimatiellia bacterium]